MKFAVSVSASRRKSRKAHLSSTSMDRRKLMSATLSQELRGKYGIRSLPVRKDDEVMVVRGIYKTREGKVTQVYRKKMVIHVERISRDKANGAQVPVGINTSNVVLTKLKIDRNRKALIDRRDRSQKP